MQEHKPGASRTPCHLRAIATFAAAVSVLAPAGSAWAAQPTLRQISPPEPSARRGAPNVLLVLLDDVGFASSSTFGGPIPTPNYDALAETGLRYNRFHTTAMCSPTRAALLTGRNHHRVGMGSVMNLAFGEPGYNSVIPKSAATIGRVLQLNGYSTAWLGKNHVTPDWEITPVGPFDRWPTHLGFDYYYGFMNGATDQFEPDLVENLQFVEAPTRADYILDEDLVDRGVSWLRTHHAAAPQKPFFLYLASGTAHAPHQAPAEWMRKFKGQFDQGWDEMRRQTFERQKRMGVIPPDTRLSPRPASIPAWSSLSREEQEVAARLMEGYAAQLAYFDHQFGRIIRELERSGQRDNTLIVYIDGDNGASGEGGVHGTSIETLNGAEPSVHYMRTQLERLGGPRTFDNYPVGWAWAMGTPFQWTKQVASHLGGTRDGLVVSWPKRIRDPGAMRDQFLHVTDIAPTIYEAVGITPPATVDGAEQMTFDGVSFVHTFDQPESPSRHRSQYFEMLGNRAFYQDGWMASTTPARLPWERKPITPPEQYEWELYDLERDFAQSRNVARQYPQRLAELKAAFQAAAEQNSALPLNNDAYSRMRTSALRPYTTTGIQSFEYFRSETQIPAAAFPDLKNQAWDLSVQIAIEGSRRDGTIITQGGWENGWGLFLFDGRPTFIYRTNPLPGRTWRLSAEPLNDGEHTLLIKLRPDSQSPGAGATMSLTVDSHAEIMTHIEATVPNTFTMEGVGVGRDFVTPLVAEYQPPFRFEGTMGAVVINSREERAASAPHQHDVMRPDQSAGGN